jgi:DNA-binding SARP family transcriptional activator
VQRGGEPVRAGGPRQLALLSLLVSAGGHTVPADRLVTQLWGEDAPDASLANLQVSVAKLRRALEPERGARGDATVLVTRHNGYAVVIDDVDADRFADLVGRAHTLAGSALVEAEQLLVEALAMWRGPAYGGVADLAPALATEARRLHELRWAATERLWAVRLAAGGQAAAVPELRALVDQAPLREELWRLLALALYRSGRQAEALDALREVRERLAEELGLDPGEPLRTLEQEVLRQDPSLDVIAAAPSAAAAAPLAESAPAESALPGRSALLAQTRRLVDRAAAGAGGVLLVSGEAGIGKTRFTGAVADQASDRGLRVGWGTWEQEEGPPLAGWRQALRELPDGDGALDHRTGSGGGDAASTVFRIADDLVAALRASPTCLVLDDVHWADPDSHRLLRRVVATLGRSPSLLVLVSREVSGQPDPEAAQTLAAVARADALRVDLTGLDAHAVGEQVQEALGHAVEPEVAAALQARTDGNPFFVREMVRALAASGVLDGDRIDDWGGVPAGVRDVVRHRLSELSAYVAQALTAAAVLGRTFDADVAEASWAGPAGEFDGALALAEVAGLV